MNNFVYLYDGTFLNLISNIEYLLNNKIKPINIKNEFNYEENLFDKTFKLDLKDSEIFIEKIVRDASSYVLKFIFYVFIHLIFISYIFGFTCFLSQFNSVA